MKISVKDLEMGLAVLKKRCTDVSVRVSLEDGIMVLQFYDVDGNQIKLLLHDADGNKRPRITAQEYLDVFLKSIGG